MAPGFLGSLLGRARSGVVPGRRGAGNASALEQIVSLRCAEAREEERRRMAVDLHDGPIQQLVNLVLRLDMAEKALPPGSEPVRAELESLRQSTRNVLQDMRRFMFELRPASLDEFALLPVLRQYIHDFRTQYGIPVELELSDTDWNIGRNREINLFRIIQEALTNVRKHAGASKVALVLARHETQVTARIRDNGKGFDVAAARLRAPQEKKLGLAGMEDRARALGGSLGIESGDGGTQVRVAIPLGPDESVAHHG